MERKNTFARMLILFIIITFFSCTSSPILSGENPDENTFVIQTIKTGNVFLYIPDSESMNDYLRMHSYLKAWDSNEIDIDDRSLSALFNNHIGHDTLQSLLFESFLRYTKNVNIQNRILTYIENNSINTNFTNSLKKLYAATPVIVGARDWQNVIQYNYNDLEFDENINLFLFNEVGVFNREMGLLLFDNNWGMISFDNENNPDMSSFTLLYGGGTNSFSAAFRRTQNINEEDIESKFNLIYYNERYKDNWIVTKLPIEGILNRAGADIIFVAHGLGPDMYIDLIETATFVIYLYNRERKTLYELNYFMNFSPINIHFIERNRIFNYLFFQILFVFLR